MTNLFKATATILCTLEMLLHNIWLLRVVLYRNVLGTNVVLYDYCFRLQIDGYVKWFEIQVIIFDWLTSVMSSSKYMY